MCDGVHGVLPVGIGGLTGMMKFLILNVCDGTVSVATAHRKRGVGHVPAKTSSWHQDMVDQVRGASFHLIHQLTQAGGWMQKKHDMDMIWHAINGKYFAFQLRGLGDDADINRALNRFDDSRFTVLGCPDNMDRDRNIVVTRRKSRLCFYRS